MPTDTLTTEQTAYPGTTSLLAAMEGIEDASRYEPGVLVRINGSAPSVVVAALVAGGVAVERVMPHRRLEDAFLALIGEES